MTAARRIDFALFGSTIMTRLLAGLLASVHGKSVLMVGESQARFRLSRGLDLSLAPLTRPQSWDLLGVLVPETTRLVTRIGGRAAVMRLDPIFCAESAPAREALAHFRHMAGAFGHAAERISPKILGGNRDSVVFRDAVLLQAGVLEPLLDRWLEQKAVLKTDRLESLTMEADGAGLARWEDQTISFCRRILCDDAAIIEHLADAPVPPSLHVSRGNTALFEPVTSLAAPVLHQLDGGLTLFQPQRGGLLALSEGRMNDGSAAVANLLGPGRAPRQIGQAEYLRATGADGAPVLGTLPTGATILAGLGSTGAFLAPALARWLCGLSAGAEADWLAAHSIHRNPLASTTAEWSAA